ncbi:hypothetical protein LWI28_018044 [Acer negundo]|uniref:Heparan-alpha-glucosaminide N-acetyltransferase catalytic domain-containing protein n=1 Tax=Acer negundo TaxID=4023 RepID=A0AAD5J6Y1_ACENE|nr:hypothetical protein LWI28_018044 [Acer negundo]
MAEIKVETSHHHYPLIVSDSGKISDQQKKQQRPKRVASLDIFRGPTVALWLVGFYVVDGAGGDWPVIGHAPWNGCNLADFVMPFFLFIVGISISLSLKRISSRIEAVKKVILRTLKLLFWGLLLQGGYSHAPDKLTYGVDVKMIRWCGILQVTCGVRGKLDPPCNAVGYIDRQVLGINHIYHHPAWRRSKACTQDSPYEGPLRNDAPSWCHAPFEPEGILSSISAILSTIIGVHFGHVLIHLKGHLARLKHWGIMGLALLVFGLTLHLTHGDIWGLKYLFLPLEWTGLNTMLVYVMAAEGIFAGFINGWYYDDPHNTLVYWIQKHVFIRVWHS